MASRPNHDWREVRRQIPLTVDPQPSTASIVIGRVMLALILILFVLIPGRAIVHLLGLA